MEQLSFGLHIYMRFYSSLSFISITFHACSAVLHLFRQVCLFDWLVQTMQDWRGQESFCYDKCRAEKAVSQEEGRDNSLITLHFPGIIVNPSIKFSLIMFYLYCVCFRSVK